MGPHAGEICSAKQNAHLLHSLILLLPTDNHMMRKINPTSNVLSKLQFFVVTATDSGSINFKMRNK